jgi:predicted O-methyltransferase YrrM
MEVFSITKFGEYLLFSKHWKGHGIHSPFIFDIVSGIFQNKIDPEIVFKIEMIRKKMLRDKRLVGVNDLGSGSRRMKHDLRRVSDIAKYSAVSEKYGMLLFNIASAFGGSSIIEFGTSLGISTMYLASSLPGSIVYTMDGCQSTSEIAHSNFLEAGLENINILTGSFDESLQTLNNGSIHPGLIFIDGDHRKEPTLRYFDKVADISGNDTVVIIDDIYHSSGMADAWEVIKSNPRVTTTIDIYKMGLVFFRKGLFRHNYIIRY